MARPMKRANGTGAIIRVTGKRRRKPYQVMVTIGWDSNGKQIRKSLGYFETIDKATIALASYNENPYDIQGGKATFSEVYDGIDALLEKHGYKRNDKGFYDVLEHNDDNIVLFCHFGVTALIVSHLIGVAAPVLWQGMIMQPTALTILGSEERIPGEATFRVQTFSDCRHLAEAGEPMSQSGYFAKIFEG